MKNLLIISLFLSLWSCTTERKAQRFYNENPEKLAALCANEFPVKDSVIVRDSIRLDTLYLETEPTILKDSFYIKADTIVRVITKKCPPAATIVKTIRHDSIIIRRDTAKEAVLIGNNAKCREALNIAVNRLEKRNKTIVWLIILLTLETIYIFRKQILKLI